MSMLMPSRSPMVLRYSRRFSRRKHGVAAGAGARSFESATIWVSDSMNRCFSAADGCLAPRGGMAPTIQLVDDVLQQDQRIGVGGRQLELIEAAVRHLRGRAVAARAIGGKKKPASSGSAAISAPASARPNTSRILCQFQIAKGARSSRRTCGSPGRSAAAW